MPLLLPTVKVAAPLPLLTTMFVVVVLACTRPLTLVLMPLISNTAALPGVSKIRFPLFVPLGIVPAAPTCRVPAVIVVLPE